MGHQQNSIAVRIQRNLASKLSKPALVKRVISDSYSDLLDILYSVLAKYYPEKVAEKVVKNIVKIVVKLALVFSNDKKVDEHEYALDDLQDKFRTLLLTVHSFDQIKYSYSQTHLLKMLKEIEESMLTLVKPPILSEKSSARVQLVFEHFGNTTMLDAFFQTDSPHVTERAKFMQIVEDLQF
ncbi:Protein of unknown function DUF758 domain containing protein [Aphelenchoides bicaudatus]|nr:Protein of unknown function DUF758 domain containing protein [Aphelenchoides bicaudatus]